MIFQNKILTIIIFSKNCLITIWKGIKSTDIKFFFSNNFASSDSVYKFLGLTSIIFPHFKWLVMELKISFRLAILTSWFAFFLAHFLQLNLDEWWLQRLQRLFSFCCFCSALVNSLFGQKIEFNSINVGRVADKKCDIGLKIDFWVE